MNKVFTVGELQNVIQDFLDAYGESHKDSKIYFDSTFSHEIIVELNKDLITSLADIPPEEEV